MQRLFPKFKKGMKGAELSYYQQCISKKQQRAMGNYANEYNIKRYLEAIKKYVTYDSTKTKNQNWFQTLVDTYQMISQYNISSNSSSMSDDLEDDLQFLMILCYQPKFIHYTKQDEVKKKAIQKLWRISDAVYSDLSHFISEGSSYRAYIDSSIKQAGRIADKPRIDLEGLESKDKILKNISEIYEQYQLAINFLYKKEGKKTRKAEGCSVNPMVIERYIERAALIPIVHLALLQSAQYQVNGIHKYKVNELLFDHKIESPFQTRESNRMLAELNYRYAYLLRNAVAEGLKWEVNEAILQKIIEKELVPFFKKKAARKYLFTHPFGIWNDTFKRVTGIPYHNPDEKAQKEAYVEKESIRLRDELKSNQANFLVPRCSPQKLTLQIASTQNIRVEDMDKLSDAVNILLCANTVELFDLKVKYQAIDKIFRNLQILLDPTKYLDKGGEKIKQAVDALFSDGLFSLPNSCAQESATAEKFGIVYTKFLKFEDISPVGLFCSRIVDSKYCPGKYLPPAFRKCRKRLKTILRKKINERMKLFELRCGEDQLAFAHMEPIYVEENGEVILQGLAAVLMQRYAGISSLKEMDIDVATNFIKQLISSEVFTVPHIEELLSDSNGKAVSDVARLCPKSVSEYEVKVILKKGDNCSLYPLAKDVLEQLAKEAVEVLVEEIVGAMVKGATLVIEKEVSKYKIKANKKTR